MLIDIHSHCYRKAIPRLPGQGGVSLPDTLLAAYDKLGVDKGCLLPLSGPEYALPCTNEDMLEIAAMHPDRFIPFCNLHPYAVSNTVNAPLEKILEQYRDAGCRGVGEVTFNLPFCDPYMQNLFRAIQKTGMPCTIHLTNRKGAFYGIIDDPGLPGLEETLASFPRLKILGHSAPFWAEIAPLATPFDRMSYPQGKVTQEGVVPKLMRKYKNLYGDLSASSGANAFLRDPEYAVKFLTEFQDRLLFGIDIASAEVGDTLPLRDFLVELKGQKKISAEVFEKITWRNAKELLGL